ncbi:general transcription factor 3C polypeptide 2-like [Engystomops pustulosus]|uniref:general transcription factor 3C polypeptide 2-like n=1 Tax=Engystomops pustulosus TaxID=76066 RepID=UPI003AFAAF3A
MAGSPPGSWASLPAEVMVQRREDESLALPALLPLGVSAPTTGVAMQEAVAPLLHSPATKCPHDIQSPENTAALPHEGPQKRLCSSAFPPQDTGPTNGDRNIQYWAPEDSSCFPQTFSSKVKSVVDLEESLHAEPDAGDLRTCLASSMQNSIPDVTPHSPLPVKVPKKRGRKSKADLQRMRQAQESGVPLVPPPGRKDLDVCQSLFIPAASNRLRSSLLASRDTLQPSTDRSPMEDKSLASEDSLLLQTPVVPKKRYRRSKAKLQKMRPAPSGRNDPDVTSINESAKKQPLFSLPTSQEPIPDPSPLDSKDKSLVSEDPSLLQTPVGPRKRGRKSKAEMLIIKMAQELEAQSHVEDRQSDSENMEEELTQSGRPRRRAAKTAMKYFQDLANEWAGSGLSSTHRTEKKVQEETGKKRHRKRKAGDSDDDVDFVVSEDVLEQEREEVEEDNLSGEESEGDLSFYRRSVFTPGEKISPHLKGNAENGLHNSIMGPVWSSAQITMDFREAQYSDWAHPEWIPHKDSWHFLSPSEAEPFLPLQSTSPPFSISREGMEEEPEPLVLGRFQSLPPHPQRQDVTFFVGGPVWSLDWCPTLWGSSSCQYVALYCHRGMDERHRLGAVHTGPALLQLWRLGVLSPDTSGDSGASFSYGLAVDDGCILDLKFCPSGGWEPPGTPRKGTEMARLGLLAMALSSGHVQIYSLPHPESLHSHQTSQGKGGTPPPMYIVCI